MAVVNTNVNGLLLKTLSSERVGQNTAMERLSTGQRINSASDDAAGWVDPRMTSQTRGLKQAFAMQAIGMINTADGALIVTNMLQRMRNSLKATVTTTSADRITLVQSMPISCEIDQLQKIQWNGKTI